MRWSVKFIKNRYLRMHETGYILTGFILIFLMLAGCQMIMPDNAALSEAKKQQMFDLEHVSSGRCIDFLSKLGIYKVSSEPDNNIVSVTGSLGQLRRAEIVLDLIDTEEKYAIENLGPASSVRALPSNLQIAKILGDIRIGTFNNPPVKDEQLRAIIDIEGDSVLAIIPVRHREQLLEFLTSSSGATASTGLIAASQEHLEIRQVDTSKDDIDTESAQPKAETPSLEIVPLKTSTVQTSGKEDVQEQLKPERPDWARTELSIQDEKTFIADAGAQAVTEDSPSAEDAGNAGIPKTLKLILKPAEHTTDSEATTASCEPVEFQNGEDILDLTLPESLTLTQLLDLAGKYLDLNYIYTPRTVGNQTVALKMHGGLKGEMRIRDLYSLLETVLKFNGLAMIRREQKLVTIVPVNEALSADPQIIDAGAKTIQAGDTVLTRIFELRYVDAASVTNLLQNMKLGVAVSTSQEAQTLFVTCYAHRMGRIEQLVNMVDKPGKARECRFRRLQYTVAPVLAEKVRSLAQEIQGIPVMMVSAKGKGSSGTGSGQPVYLDTDERTNRLVMIGHEEQLGFLEELVDVLDVGRQDLRIQKVYNLKHMEAQEALGKLQQLEVLGPATASAGRPRMGASGKASSARAAGTQDDPLTAEPIVVVLEATNQLLVKATEQQHARIGESIDQIDISAEDLRTLEVYEIQHLDAEQVRTKLEELDMIAGGSAGSSRITARSAKSGSAKSPATGNDGTVDVLVPKPQVVVTESTNSLLINATVEQHTQIATIISYVDSKTPEEEIPYRIYPLENSSPQHVAGLLEQLIQETTEDQEGKIEKVAEVLTKTEDQITIVPDPNTFSVIVYASRKNQEWIENLIKSLDKRRPQVLIDVTLVEITRTDTFEYDLNLVASAQEVVIDNIGIEPIHRIDSKSRLEGGFNLLDQEGNPTGQTKAFYSDEKVQALLTAIQRKNYGRVLAKPKILVDDGQEGEISTTDETTYLKESIQVPDQGAPITTRDFEPIEAKIQLQITPHIGEGDLLRLDVHLSREDFGTRPTEGAPPDKATSKITTTVFVPDKHTVILGGLVKLNQSKGGSKVPILGDIPLVGALFRSVDNSDVEKKLYVFLKANMVRPNEKAGLEDLQKVSDQQREIFEKSEAEFQKHEDIPGITPEPMQPERVLNEL